MSMPEAFICNQRSGSFKLRRITTTSRAGKAPTMNIQRQAAQPPRDPNTPVVSKWPRLMLVTAAPMLPTVDRACRRLSA